jgi:hypothetical protein
MLDGFSRKLNFLSDLKRHPAAAKTVNDLRSKVIQERVLEPLFA